MRTSVRLRRQIYSLPSCVETIELFRSMHGHQACDESRYLTAGSLGISTGCCRTANSLQSSAEDLASVAVAARLHSQCNRSKRSRQAPKTGGSHIIAAGQWQVTP